MLWRLVAKLLFKASVPLLVMAGVLSYGVSLRGGDPAAMWASVAERGSGQFSALFAGVQQDASQAVGTITRRATALSADQTQAGRTEVFTWKDDAGVRHYSSSRPLGVVAERVSVDPNVNVLAPLPTPAVSEPQAAQKAWTASQEGVVDGRQLPGVAGQVLATRQSEKASEEPLDLSAGVPELDPAQLLKMLQAAEK